MSLHYGFNFQWMYQWAKGKRPSAPDERALDFLVEFGFNFVRLPIDYRFLARELGSFLPDQSFWKKMYSQLETKQGRKFKHYHRFLEGLAHAGLLNIPLEGRLWKQDLIYLSSENFNWEYIDSYLESCSVRGLHLCLNLHRAPGYCINDNHLERYNLWMDALVQDVFVFMWGKFAQRYKDVSNEYLSFNLLNEPPRPGQFGFTREKYTALLRRTVTAIRNFDPFRAIVVDGVNEGRQALPELADLEITQSGRGYQPQNITHYLASWWQDHAGQPSPVYPGTHFDGQRWDKNTMKSFYQSWRDIEKQGVKVHIGELGCYNKTPDAVARRWFADLLAIFKEFKWGYALWEFEGPFGIVKHGRPGSTYKSIKGYEVDAALLELLIQSRSIQQQ